MRRFTWNCCSLLVLTAAATVMGCAKPAPTTSTPAPADTQASSTTGGGMEVPMDAPAEAAPAEAAPAEAAPAEAAPAEAAPAEAAAE